MSLARTRARTLYPSYGTQTLYGSLYTSTRENGFETVTDIVGNRDGDNGFDLTRTTIEGGLLNGERSNPWEGVWASWTDWPYENRIVGYGPLGFNSNESSAALRALTLTNPGRHEALAPAFLLELRDLPKMLRFAGRLRSAVSDSFSIFMGAFNIWKRNDGIPFTRGLTPSQVRKLIGSKLLPEQQGGLSAAQIIAAANLAVQFGWAPIIRDLQKACDFQGAVQRRRNEINRLCSGRGLKRRITIQDDEDTNVVKDVWFHTVAGVVTTDITIKRITKRWAVCRYRPTFPVSSPPTDQQLMNQIYGLSVHGVLSSAWEVLPWSWMIDWFTNFGDLIKLSNNEIATTSTSCVMSLASVKFTNPGGIAIWPGDGSKSWTGCISTSETKGRYPYRPGLDAFSVKLPFLGNNQLSILGSLALLRGR